VLLPFLAVASLCLALAPSAGALTFSIEFYFNLVGAFTGLGLSDPNAPNTPYQLLTSPRLR